ncbi:MAG: hypothetical protein HY922_14615 [Elusimicrobia bacterium]|nr:hypothetical protein [Elusimicrobiota bacterium]
MDTVSHSGPSAAGVFGYSLDEVDLFSGWTEVIAVLGKKAEEIVAAQEEIRQALPFEQKGMDSDNGDEFINYAMDRYCQDTTTYSVSAAGPTRRTTRRMWSKEMARTCANSSAGIATIRRRPSQP